MSVRIAALLASAALITACATAQENPNYQYSSKYGQQATDYASADSNMQTASYTTPSQQPITSYVNQERANCDSRETNRGLIGAGIGGAVGAYAGEKIIGGTGGALAGAALGGTAGYGIGDKTVDCDQYGYEPEYVPAQPAAVASAPSMTESEFDARTMSGTPGYNVYVAETTAPVPAAPGIPVEMAPTRPNGAQPVAYDYSQNVIVADAATQMPSYETRQLSYGSASYAVVPGDTVYSLSRRLCVPIAEITTPNAIGADYGISIGQTLSLPASRC